MSKKEMIQNVSILFISVLVFFGVLEIGLNIFNPQLSVKTFSNSSTNKNHVQYDEIMGWVNTPNFESIMQDSIHHEYSVMVKINSKGLRDKEYSYNKTERAKRILIIGDSQTWGMGVENNETYTSILNSLLNNTEVLNMGVPGYGNDQELLLLENEGLKYKPDVVIMAFCCDAVNRNSRDNNNQSAYKSLYVLTGEKLTLTNVPVPKEKYSWYANENLSTFRYIKRYLGQHSHTFVFFKNRLMNTPWTRHILVKYGIADPPIQDPVIRTYANVYNSQMDYQWNLTKAILKEANRVVKENNASFIIVLIPNKEQVYKEDWELAKRQYDLNANDYTLSKPNDILVKFGKESNITVLDLLPEFKKNANDNDSEKLYFKNDGHMNKNGHKLAAETIHNLLIGENLYKNR